MTDERMNRARSLAIWLVLALLGTGLFLVLQWLGSSRQPAVPNDAQIRNVLDLQVDSWNRGDLDGFMSGYWKSDQLTFCSGSTITKGWQPTLDRYRSRYQAEGKEMGTLDFREIVIEPLSADLAMVRGRWRLRMKSGEPEGLFTLLVRRFPDGWRITYDHTSAQTP